MAQWRWSKRWKVKVIHSDNVRARNREREKEIENGKRGNPKAVFLFFFNNLFCFCFFFIRMEMSLRPTVVSEQQMQPWREQMKCKILSVVHEQSERRDDTATLGNEYRDELSYFFYFDGFPISMMNVR